MTQGFLVLALFCLVASIAMAFQPPGTLLERTSVATQQASATDVLEEDHCLERRGFFRTLAGAATTAMAVSSLSVPSPAWAASGLDLDGYLYKIVRVREATQQERRLIQSGKFKDKARQNVKLAVKFMIQNYQLSDSVVGASAYLSGSSQMRAIDVGQAAVQNLQTILEYFDASDVENIKVNSMSGKEGLVIKGLESAQVKIDDFLAYFPDEAVSAVRKKIQEENELNVKEFDPSLGDIINLPPPS